MGSSQSYTSLQLPTPPSTSLLSLPNELLLIISAYLDRASHIHSLILTSRRLNHLLTPTLHTPSPSCTTALHHAIARGDEEIVRLLLDAGAKCDIQDAFGDTAVHAAVTRANSLAVKRKLAWLPLPFRSWGTETRFLSLLLGCGPPLDIGNNKGDTSLHIAVSGAAPCAATVAGMLLDNGAQVNMRNGWKYTPLHVAAMAGAVEVVEVLIRGGADVDADGEWCLTPGKLAEARGLTSVVRVLGKGRGVNVPIEKDSFKLSNLRVWFAYPGAGDWVLTQLFHLLFATSNSHRLSSFDGYKLPNAHSSQEKSHRGLYNFGGGLRIFPPIYRSPVGVHVVSQGLKQLSSRENRQQVKHVLIACPEYILQPSMRGRSAFALHCIDSISLEERWKTFFACVEVHDG
ncbi:ankyrin repeat-containing domain protein [Morchella snyderi]|nr:ankyrin repeat-containing domain protein [Morchella snyderi]